MRVVWVFSSNSNSLSPKIPSVYLSFYHWLWLFHHLQGRKVYLFSHQFKFRIKCNKSRADSSVMMKMYNTQKLVIQCDQSFNKLIN